jgi:hypothetical protein
MKHAVSQVLSFHRCVCVCVCVRARARVRTRCGPINEITGLQKYVKPRSWAHSTAFSDPMPPDKLGSANKKTQRKAYIWFT